MLKWILSIQKNLMKTHKCNLKLDCEFYYSLLRNKMNSEFWYLSRKAFEESPQKTELRISRKKDISIIKITIYALSAFH